MGSILVGQLLLLCDEGRGFLIWTGLIEQVWVL